MKKKDKDKNGNVYDSALLKRMLKQVRPYKKEFIIVTIFGLILSVLGPLKPKIVMLTIRQNIETDIGIGLRNMVLIYFAVLLLEAIFQYLYRYLTNVVSQNVIKDLRTKIFEHISSLQLKFFNKTPIGKLTTRTINDVEALNKTFSEGFTNIIQDVMTIVFIIVFMLLENWKLALITLIPFPFIVIATYIFKEKVKSAFQRVRSTVQDLNSFMQEHISGMKIVQIFAVEEETIDRFNVINHKNKQANVDAVTYYAVYFPVIEILSAVALALLVWYGGSRIAIERAYVDEIVGFYMWSVMLFRPLRMLADRFNTLQMGMVASERIFDLLDTEMTFEEQGELAPSKINGDITFDNVWFAYDEDDWVLKDISFKMKGGDTLAFVGSTGSGKSTTINLINRFYDIQKGTITVDGKPIKSYDLHNLRSKIATVQQDVFLFSGSIYDNIVMQDRLITMDQVINAAKQVGVHEFIETLPGGYNYRVQERGSTLSTGQRQLISFIRAMVVNPDILILDEATAAIDTETELLIQKATEKLMKERTAIVIAHRLSTIQNADQIIVLDQGKLVESGSHDELMNKVDGAYRRLHAMQFQKELA